MIDGAEHIVTRLDRSIADIRRYVNSLEDPAQRRYAGASAELITPNRDQLRERIAWAMTM